MILHQLIKHRVNKYGLDEHPLVLVGVTLGLAVEVVVEVLVDLLGLAVCVCLYIYIYIYIYVYMYILLCICVVGMYCRSSSPGGTCYNYCIYVCCCV